MSKTVDGSSFRGKGVLPRSLSGLEGPPTCRGKMPLPQIRAPTGCRSHTPIPRSVDDEPAAFDRIVPLQEYSRTDARWQTEFLVPRHVTVLSGHELRK